MLVSCNLQAPKNELKVKGNEYCLEITLLIVKLLVINSSRYIVAVACHKTTRTEDMFSYIKVLYCNTIAYGLLQTSIKTCKKKLFNQTFSGRFANESHFDCSAKVKV